jgi:hypothetical protein
VNLSCGTLTEIRDVWVPPSLRQRLGLALFSIGLGLIAGTSGIGLIVAESNSDPRGAFAFAPVQTPAVATAAAKPDAEMPPVKTVLAREITDSNAITREIAKRENVKPCRGWSHDADNQCLSDPTSNPEPAAPGSNPLVAAVVPTGHVGDRTIVAELHPAASLENTQTVEVSAPLSTDAVPAPVETPTLEPPATQPRQRSGQRHTYQQSSALFDFHPRRGRQQHFWPFW